MDPISLAVTLAQFAPKLIGWLGGDKAEAVAEKAVQIAQEVTGATNGKDAVAMLGQDPEKAIAYRQAVLAQETEFRKLALQETQAYLGDTQDARSRDVKLREMNYRNVRANTMLAGAGGVVVGILFVAIWASPLDEYVKGILTLVLGRALGYIDQGFNFEFGTTRGSAKKDETINALSAK